MNRNSLKLAVACTLLTGAVVSVGFLPVSSFAQEEPVVAEVIADSVSVNISFGTEIDKPTRQLVGESNTFTGDIGQVYCFSHIRGISADTMLTHAWYYNGKTMARVQLPVRSTDWRTWSSKRVLPGWAGYWEVKVLDGDGKVLASAGFDLE